MIISKQTSRVLFIVNCISCPSHQHQHRIIYIYQFVKRVRMFKMLIESNTRFRFRYRRQTQRMDMQLFPHLALNTSAFHAHQFFYYGYINRIKLLPVTFLDLICKLLYNYLSVHVLRKHEQLFIFKCIRRQLDLTSEKI